MATLDNIITGSFTSDGTAKTLTLPCDVDYMEVTNYTKVNTNNATGAVRSEWYRGLAANEALIQYKSGSNAVLSRTASGLSVNGFTLVNTSTSTPGAPLTITGVSQANPGVVSLASTSGLSSGDTVRIYGTTAMLQIAGMDFTIASLVANTSFTLAYLNSSGFAAAATAGTVRRIPYDPIYYPRRRFITNITAATSAVITLSVTHGFTVGQLVRIIVPSGWGMTEINNTLARVTAINTTTNTITVNVDSSAYTAFAFPTSAVAAAGITFPQVVPVGDAPDTIANTNAEQSVLDGATVNQGLIGMILGGGASAPGGEANDVIYWKALKSSQVQS
jgi:hypothetical protein